MADRLPQQQRMVRLAQLGPPSCVLLCAVSCAEGKASGVVGIPLRGGVYPDQLRRVDGRL